MIPFEDFKKNAMREAIERVHAWKQEHSEEYSRFSVDMMKMMRNDFSCLERIFKMAVDFVPLSVLIECRKLLALDSNGVLSVNERTAAASRVVDELMELKGYLRLGVYTETIGDMDCPAESNNGCIQPSEHGKQFLIREFSLSDEDMSEADDEHIYIPSVTAQEFWETLPSFIQMAVFTLGKGHSADEMATLSKRIMLSAIQALPEIFFQLRGHILEGKNSLLMCTMYYICFDHGLPKSALALSKVELSTKQISYIRESVKVVVENLVEKSIAEGLDKKSEWIKLEHDIEDEELQRVIKYTLANTKGKHGRRIIQQEIFNIDDFLIGDKQVLRESIMSILNEMEHDYEIAYIKEALIRSRHMDKDVPIASFHHAICDMTGKKYGYDPAQRLDTEIVFNKEKFENSKSSKHLRGRRLIRIWTEVFAAIP